MALKMFESLNIIFPMSATNCWSLVASVHFAPGVDLFGVRFVTADSQPKAEGIRSVHRRDQTISSWAFLGVKNGCFC